MSDAQQSNEKPLVDRVRGWLDKQGYPLELRTAREFRRAGAHVEVGQFYTDPDSDEPREIDVIASFVFTLNPEVSVAISFVIECKRSVDRPWVMFARPGTVHDLPLQARVYHSRWSARIDEVAKSWIPTRSSIDNIGEHAYGGVPVVFGDQTGKKGDQRTGRDTVFEAIMSASKAAYSRAISGTGLSPTTVHVVFPVIVVDAPLFSCGLPDYVADIEVKPIAQGIPLIWARPLGGRQRTVIDVVSADAIPHYVQDSQNLANGLASMLSKPGLP